MAIISVRYSDVSKAQAEEIANSIGLPLSTVINIFLNRFIAERGFPFDVTAPKKETTMFSKEDLEERVLKAIKNSPDHPKLPKSSYIEPSENKLRTTK